ncbi:MAG: glycosyltransferase [Chloroflexi bacterium]|nr:glycosyltransferase [Chloroflexota bacterium]
MPRRILIAPIVMLCLFIALGWLLVGQGRFLHFVLSAAPALLITAYLIVTLAIRERRRKRGGSMMPIISLSLLFVLLPPFFALILYVEGMFTWLIWALLIAQTLTFLLDFLTIPLALYHRRQEDRTEETYTDCCPSVSIVVPAYNEEKTIGHTIQSLIEASYPDKEIIVIDDGSKDSTYLAALRYNQQGVKVFRRPNGGKAAALNYGVRVSRGEIIVFVDADTLVSKNAIMELVKRFKEPAVGAVAGNIRVMNRTNLLTRCQALEYIVSIGVFRRALAVFGKVTVVPGALGAYRRTLLVSTGLHDPDTVAEDFDTTVKALKCGTVIQASTRAIAYTEAPQTLADLTRQRLRWYRGNFQTMWKHRDAAFNSRFGFLQALSYPYLLFSMLILPAASLVVVISLILAILSGLAAEILYIFVFFLLLQFLLSVLAIQLEEDDMKLALYSPFFVVGYKHFCDFIMLKSFFDVLFRRRVEWGRARRIGVGLPAAKDL